MLTMKHFHDQLLNVLEFKINFNKKAKVYGQ